jgi:hypothetical protein
LLRGDSRRVVFDKARTLIFAALMVLRVAHVPVSRPTFVGPDKRYKLAFLDMLVRRSQVADNTRTEYLVLRAPGAQVGTLQASVSEAFNRAITPRLQSSHWVVSGSCASHVSQITC